MLEVSSLSVMSGRGMKVGISEKNMLMVMCLLKMFLNSCMFSER